VVFELPALIVLVGSKGVDAWTATAAGGSNHRFGGASTGGQAEQLRTAGEIARIRNGETHECGIIGKKVDGVVSGIEAERETERAGGKFGAVLRGGEGLARLRELHLETEEIGLEHLAGFKSSAGGGDRRLVSSHAAIESDNRFAGFTEIQRSADDLRGELLLRGAQIEVRGFDAGASGGATSGRSAAAVEIIGDGAGGVEVVDPAGLVEVEGVSERALVKDGSERHHRRVRLRVASGERKLREPGGAGLLNHRLRDLDPGTGSPGVGILAESRGDGVVE
jgi:hypothetical protein